MRNMKAFAGRDGEGQWIAQNDNALLIIIIMFREVKNEKRRNSCVFNSLDLRCLTLNFVTYIELHKMRLSTYGANRFKNEKMVALGSLN